ncbi:hypothetical protein SK128_007119 [Halocaridina rubra]|uniref:Uncharacterized protein n=1 Tax=Halocaridina rubra TaxID=373956 RepID=A0AAN9A853_HALRR
MRFVEKTNLKAYIILQTQVAHERWAFAASVADDVRYAAEIQNGETSISDTDSGVFEHRDYTLQKGKFKEKKEVEGNKNTKYGFLYQIPLSAHGFFMLQGEEHEEEDQHKDAEGVKKRVEGKRFPWSRHPLTGIPTIPYEIQFDDEDLKASIKRAMDAWSTDTCIEFAPRTKNLVHQHQHKSTIAVGAIFKVFLCLFAKRNKNSSRPDSILCKSCYQSLDYESLSNFRVAKSLISFSVSHLSGFQTMKTRSLIVL